MHTSTLLYTLIAALAATAAAKPAMSVRSVNDLFPRQSGKTVCSTDADCQDPAYPYCICQEQVPGAGGGPWMQIYACNDVDCDGCLDEC